MNKERRKHQRIPIIKDLAEPVNIIIMAEKPIEMPAVLTNLSAGGMCLVVFAHVIGNTKFKLVLNLKGVEGIELQCRVAWAESKGDTTVIGVSFFNMKHEDMKKINHMAEHFLDCETKRSFGIKDICDPTCNYWPMCVKH